MTFRCLQDNVLNIIQGVEIQVIRKRFTAIMLCAAISIGGFPCAAFADDTEASAHTMEIGSDNVCDDLYIDTDCSVSDTGEASTPPSPLYIPASPVLLSGPPVLMSPVPKPVFNVSDAEGLIEAFKTINASAEGEFSVFLEADITVTQADINAYGSFELTANETTLYGGGNTLTVSYGYLNVTDEAILNLGDDSYDEELTLLSDYKQNSLIYINGSAAVNMYDNVTIGGNTPNECFGQAAGVQLTDDAVFHMYGGTIKNCHSLSVSGAVFCDVRSSFIMDGGEITDCTGNTGGAVGVNYNASFTMNDGKITDCTDEWYGGGAVCIGCLNAPVPYYAPNEGTPEFTMNGGLISGCKAKSSYGGGAIFAVDGIINLNAGEISENSSEKYGGGIFSTKYYKEAVVNISSDFKLYSNKAVVYGDDIFSSGAKLTLGQVPSGLTHKECKHPIIGWFMDYTSRWRHDGTGASLKMYTPPSGPSTKVVGLKAAHGAYEYTIEYYIDGNPDSSLAEDGICYTASVSESEIPDKCPNGYVLDNIVTTVTREPVFTAGLRGKLSVKVYYERESITVTPVNLIIYTGGTGVDNAVTDSDGTQAESNGLPVLGFTVSIPDTIVMEDKYDVSEDVRLVLDGNDNGSYDDPGVDEIWTLNLVGSISDNEKTGVYYVSPVSDEQNGIAYIYAQTDIQGGIEKYYISDKFDFGSSNQITAYSAALFAKSGFKALVRDKNGIENELNIKTDFGNLTIKGVCGNTDDIPIVHIDSSNKEVFENAVTALKTLNGKRPEIFAADSGLNRYTLYGTDIGAEADGVMLLMDDVLPEGRKMIESYIKENGLADESSALKHLYIDIVLPENGRAVAASDKPVDIYWRIPDTADINEGFKILHFKGLDRNTTVMDDSINSEEVFIYSSESGDTLETVTIGKDKYIKFTVESFSPFTMIYTEKLVTYYTLSYDSDGGSIFEDERYPENTLVNLTHTPVKSGYDFMGWYEDNKLTKKVTHVVMDSDKKVYAGWKKKDGSGGGKTVPLPSTVSKVPEALNGEEHFAYIVGYADGLIRPDDNITRAEVATIFFRLLNENIRKENITKENVFSDVPAEAWYCTAVSSMSRLGIIKGYPDGTFEPNKSITRAEFAAIAARFDNYAYFENVYFTDTNGHWAESDINKAAYLGWVSGYPDGSFMPNKAITRAEAMSLINRVLNRNPKTVNDLHSGMTVWSDNTDIGKWYYIDVQEASNSHDYIRTDGGYEKWIEIKPAPDWAALER